jgi:hypothetical protein
MPMAGKVVLAAVAILNGHWIYDAARSRVLDPDLQITKTATGTLHRDGGTGAPYEFDLAGGSYPLSNGRTISWTPLAPTQWRASKKNNDEVLETAIVTLHGNTLRTVTHGKLPDGTPYERTVTYRRGGQGDGLVGRWRSIKVDTGSTPDAFIISTAGDGVVTWRIPTDLQVITGPFDGTDLPIVGPRGPTGATIAMHTDGPNRFAYVMKNDGQIAERGTITISGDHHRLTELTWDVQQPERKSKLVYERNP